MPKNTSSANDIDVASVVSISHTCVHNARTNEQTESQKSQAHMITRCSERAAHDPCARKLPNPNFHTAQDSAGRQDVSSANRLESKPMSPGSRGTHSSGHQPKNNADYMHAQGHDRHAHHLAVRPLSQRLEPRGVGLPSVRCLGLAPVSYTHLTLPTIYSV